MTTADDREAGAQAAGGRRRRAAEYLGLERNVVVVSAVVFLLGFGEELWKRYLPKYLEALGAGVGIVGLFGATKDFFDAIYQYPGGWLADRVGRRRAFLVFIALASAGYLVYLLSPSWPFVFLGLALSMSWASMAGPAVFAVRSEEHTSELQSRQYLVCRLMLEKKETADSDRTRHDPRRYGTDPGRDD